VEELERNLSVVFELRRVRSIYALERSEELRPIRPSRVNARVWKLGQSRDKPYGREPATDLDPQPIFSRYSHLLVTSKMWEWDSEDTKSAMEMDHWDDSDVPYSPYRSDGGEGEEGKKPEEARENERAGDEDTKADPETAETGVE
jgi:hypothetical protein